MEESQERKVTYKNLSGALKTLVVFGWIVAGIWVLSFFVGFFGAF